MAFAAGVLTATNLWLAVLGNTVMTETLFAVLVMLSLMLLLHGLASESPKSFCGCGAALGLSVLCRPTMFYFPLLVPFLLVPRHRRRRRILAREAGVGLPLAAVVLPWMDHDY